MQPNVAHAPVVDWLFVLKELVKLENTGDKEKEMVIIPAMIKSKLLNYECLHI